MGADVTDAEENIRLEIERADAQLAATLDDMRRKAELALSAAMRNTVQEAMRQRGELILRLNSTVRAHSGMPLETSDGVPNGTTPEVDDERGETEGRRTAREVVLEVLKAAQGPVRGLALTAAVVREGLTKSAAEKVRRRLVDGGVIRSEDGGFVLVDEGREDSG